MSKWDSTCSDFAVDWQQLFNPVQVQFKSQKTGSHSASRRHHHSPWTSQIIPNSLQKRPEFFPSSSHFIPSSQSSLVRYTLSSLGSSASKSCLTSAAANRHNCHSCHSCQSTAVPHLRSFNSDSVVSLAMDACSSSSYGFGGFRVCESTGS